MRTILKVHSAVLLVTTLALSGKVFAGNDPDTEKKKTYSKSYPVSSSDKIDIENKFGELKINTWDKNEVKVDVTMTAEAGTEERAQRMLDLISIEDGKENGGVYFKTKYGNEKNKDDELRNNKGERQRLSIDYVVYLPAHNPLYALNEFGPMSIGDYSGEATFISKFGSFTSGKLTNTKKVSVEFGQATIGGINGGELSIKFSKGTVDNLDGTVHATFEFCDGVKLKLDNDIKGLTVKNSYTHLYLDLSTNLSATFDISTSFSEVHNKSNFSIKEEGEDNDERHGPHFNHKYSGKAGSGGTPMKIKSEFGEITLGHNLTVDMSKDEDKDDKGDKKGKKHTRAI